LIPGRDFFIRAYKLLKHGLTTMDTLIALSTGISFLFSTVNLFVPNFISAQGHESGLYFESAAVIIAFVLVGKYLEEKAKYGSTNALRALMNIQPKTVCVVRNGQELEIKASEVQLHDRVLVKSGAVIPVDGIVVKGESFVDESSMTGEPLTVQRQKGNMVLAGTLVQNGVLTILAQKTGRETSLARIIRAVVDAQSSKAPLQKKVDKLSAWFVPTVLLAAFISFASWMAIGGANYLLLAIQTSVSVLVIACPCALGLATPTALMAALGQAAVNGVLVRDPESLELACEITTVITDKTGTLTKGKPKVIDTFILDNADLSVLLALVSGSEHPLSTATAQYLKSIGVTWVGELHTEAIPGIGLMGTSLDENYFFGSLQACYQRDIEIPNRIAQNLDSWKENSYSMSFFSKNNKVIAAIAISDELKATSKEGIEKLKNLGVEVVMATGDHEVSANQIAKVVGIQHVYANLTPIQKLELIHDYKKKGKIVAFIGDGLNDAAALASADVSVAMGQGSDIAMGVAGLTLMHSDLVDFAKVIQLSKKTTRIIKQNLFWAFVFNIICIPLAAGVLYPAFGVLLNPMVASAAMAFSSIAVVVNSLRLNYLYKI
jgi:Cu2+-exporting ATPase